MSGLKDKVVVVTGGSSGIGRATALGFAKQGAKVVITGRRTGPLNEARRDHPNIAAVVADVSSSPDAAQTVEETSTVWGRLDILINNAGAGAILPLAKTTTERISGIFSVNVIGPSLLAAATLPYLKAAKGSIIRPAMCISTQATR